MRRPGGYTLGDWLATCYRCGRTALASAMKRQWQGYYVCPDHWEPRHPQDFVRGQRDIQTPPWTQPPIDIFIGVCTWNSQSAIPGYAIGGCIVPGRMDIDPETIQTIVPDMCTIFGRQAVPGWAMPGCILPGYDPVAA